MDESTDVVVREAVSSDEWSAMGREIAARDPEAFAELQGAVRDLVDRVRSRHARSVGVLGLMVPRARA